MTSTFKKNEKLKSRKQLQELFASGKTVSAYPLLLVYKAQVFKDNVKIKAAVSVSKKNFKKAVDRNYIKRLLREVYRVQKQQLYEVLNKQYAITIIYVGKTKPTYKQLDITMNKVLNIWKKHLKDEP